MLTVGRAHSDGGAAGFRSVNARRRIGLLRFCYSLDGFALLGDPAGTARHDVGRHPYRIGVTSAHQPPLGRACLAVVRQSPAKLTVMGMVGTWDMGAAGAQDSSGQRPDGLGLELTERPLYRRAAQDVEARAANSSYPP
jgi:hypothetical protein